MSAEAEKQHILKFVLKVFLDDETFEVDCTEHRTFEDVYVHLNQGEVDLRDLIFEDQDGKMIQLHQSVAGYTDVNLRAPAVEVEVMGKKVNLDVKIGKSTVGELRNKLQIDHLCADGYQLNDEQIVQHNMKLRGPFAVDVEDRKCFQQAHRLTMYENNTVEDLLNAYHIKTNRKVRALRPLELTYKGERLEEMKDTLLDCKLVHGSIVQCTSPAFSIFVRKENESEGGVELIVEDHFSVEMVKKLYLQQTQETLSPEDNLLYDNENLDDEQMLWQCKFDHEAVLYIDILEAPEVHRYICADCGEDVALKREDVIMCRNCDYRIVYKKRTPNPCQYLAR